MVVVHEKFISNDEPKTQLRFERYKSLLFETETRIEMVIGIENELYF